MLSIVAVVATHNRPELLAGRSLASIALQTRTPDYLVVVDDSDMGVRSANAGIVARLVIPGTKAFYLENHRTPGASGAWNAGERSSTVISHHRPPGCLKQVRSSLLHRRRHMRVQVSGHRDAAMAEMLGHYLRVYPIGKHQGGVAMP